MFLLVHVEFILLVANILLKKTRPLEKYEPPAQLKLISFWDMHDISSLFSRKAQFVLQTVQKGLSNFQNFQTTLNRRKDFLVHVLLILVYRNIWKKIIQIAKKTLESGLRYLQVRADIRCPRSGRDPYNLGTRQEWVNLQNSTLAKLEFGKLESVFFSQLFDV